MLEQPCILNYSSIQYLNHPLSQTQLVTPLTVQHECDLWDAMSLRWSPYTSHQPILTTNSSLIGQKDKSQHGCYQNTK